MALSGLEEKKLKNSLRNRTSEGDILLSDVTTNDVSITAHGFCPKAPNDTTKFLRGDATWATISSGPKFYAYQSASPQGLTTGVEAKITLDGESFDTNNNFDSTTNYRFTPTVAGYYQLNATILVTGTTITSAYGRIYKNTGIALQSLMTPLATATLQSVPMSTILFANGSTDYFEMKILSTGVGLAVSNSEHDTFFCGALIS